MLSAREMAGFIKKARSIKIGSFGLLPDNLKTIRVDIGKPIR
jgi:hypothetical protein